MARNDPRQHMTFGSPQYQLAVRTFIPTADYLGFVGDGRSFSTSADATYRSGMFLVVDVSAGRITEPLVGRSTGTRLAPTDTKYFARVKTRLKGVTNHKGTITLRAHMEAHDPFPLVEKIAPNIDTDIVFTAFLKNGNLFVTGDVWGDAFPSTEVFIRDADGQGLLLLGFDTPHGITGTVRLVGAGTRQLGRFRKAIKLERDGKRFIRTIPWSGEEPPDDEDDRLILIQDKPHETPAIPADALFEFDGATIKPNAETLLRKWVTLLSQQKGKRVVIEGHTDSVGTPEYNRALSFRRAIAVQAWFVGAGVDGAAFFGVDGLGEGKPIASNATPEGRRLNRRVEIKFRSG